MILCRFWCEALEEVLVKSCRCPYMISYRFLGGDLVEILLKSSSRGPCVKILKMSGMLLARSCMKIL
jgi:hypothetical protein